MTEIIHTIYMAEGEKKADHANFELYGFESLKELQVFRKAYPEKMKEEYHYELSSNAQTNGKNIVTANHYKKFIKLVKASGISI
ncbi:hypothetical protein [Yersinia sp. Marseille-Q3913]|uniref:hypothetical protein n=1 Tax=Yersinia sp. Marseille-Q3913 TaxID=2830769 RepID=UPI001BAF28AA|nr:hypothetical protein [Yersinia sp. Marseille-Q3913]MBS0057642.1 hypothetical protein [Yersinia sp. Marseille-Q3913]